jgi:hypothetical protein
MKIISTDYVVNVSKKCFNFIAKDSETIKDLNYALSIESLG